MHYHIIVDVTHVRAPMFKNVLCLRTSIYEHATVYDTQYFATTPLTHTVLINTFLNTIPHDTR